MDWTKAKNILIIALVVTNLVLIITYLNQDNGLSNKDEEMESVTIKLLESKNIFVDTDIPTEHRRMPKLTVQYDKMNEETIADQLDQQKTLSTEEQTDDNLIAVTKDFIEKCKLMNENVTFDSIERTSDYISVVYKNYIDGIGIEESHMIFTIREGKITELKRFWLNPVEVSETKKKVIPAAAALIKFMSENNNQEKIYVHDISLIYWLDSESFETESAVTDTAFPAWKITYNRGQIKYIPAWEQ